MWFTLSYVHPQEAKLSDDYILHCQSMQSKQEYGYYRSQARSMCRDRAID